MTRPHIGKTDALARLDAAHTVALVAQWVTDHYAEHVPHVQGLVSEWKMAADARR